MKEGRYHDGLLMSQRVATEDKDFSGFPTAPENSIRHDCDNAARARRLCKLSYGAVSSWKRSLPGCHIWKRLEIRCVGYGSHNPASNVT